MFLQTILNQEALKCHFTYSLRDMILDKVKTPRVLKEQCHEDFAVLGQFCAKIVTLRLRS